jgi:predicted nucleotidyltransferase
LTDRQEAIKQAISPLLAVISNSTTVDSILCFGSYAVGTQHTASDLDLFVFCAGRIPDQIERQRWYSDVEAISRIELNYQSPGWDNQWNPQMDRVWLGNLEIDLCFNTIEWLETVVRKVTLEGQLSVVEMTFRPYTILGLLDQSIIMHDRSGRLQQVVGAVHPYPPKLKDKLIAENWPLLTDRLKEMRECVSKEIGNIAFLFHLGGACDALVTVLLALNERHDSATKRVEQELQMLGIQPQNLSERIQEMLEGPFDRTGRIKTVERLDSIVSDVAEILKKGP